MHSCPLDGHTFPPGIWTERTTHYCEIININCRAKKLNLYSIDICEASADSPYETMIMQAPEFTGMIWFDNTDWCF